MQIPSSASSSSKKAASNPWLLDHPLPSELALWYLPVLSTPVPSLHLRGGACVATSNPEPNPLQMALYQCKIIKRRFQGCQVGVVGCSVLPTMLAFGRVWF